MKTGWVDQQHRCSPPTRLHVSHARVGAIWRCECWREWAIARVWDDTEAHGSVDVTYRLMTFLPVAVQPSSVH